MNRENFHTHTVFCDGKNTAAEMAEAAAEKGFSALGFSGHSYLDFDCGWCMSKEGTEKYNAEINRLKAEYYGRLNIYRGLEHDIFSPGIEPVDYDFTIGSVHYIEKEGEYLPVDDSFDKQLEGADKYFSSSVYGYCRAYYDTVGQVLEKTGADIIGHFDLVTKFNEGDCRFSTKDPQYISACVDALDRLLPYGKPFEINTGAIARGKRATPYPSIDIADYIHSKGGYFILTSDCHNAPDLDCFFDEALKMYSKYEIVSFEEILREKLK